MTQLYAILCNEPWCYPKSEVDKLTDYQAWELIIKPAVERARRAERGRESGFGRDGLPRRKAKKARLPTREEYVRVGVATFGGDAEALGRQYDAVMGTPDAG